MSKWHGGACRMTVFWLFGRGSRMQVSMLSATWRCRGKCFHSGRHGNSYCLPNMSNRAAILTTANQGDSVICNINTKNFRLMNWKHEVIVFFYCDAVLLLLMVSDFRIKTRRETIWWISFNYFHFLNFNQPGHQSAYKKIFAKVR